jgi:excisionase family DNA binding protein
MLGLSDASTYAAIQRGEIPAVRVGRKILMPTQALTAMLDNAKH